MTDADALRVFRQLIASCLSTQRAILHALGLPRGARVADDLLGAPPWPTLTPREQARAIDAMHGILWLQATLRRVVEGDAIGAATAALYAGVLCNDAGIHAGDAASARARARAGGYARGRRLSAQAAQDARRIEDVLRLWQRSEVLQDLSTSAAAFVHEKVAATQGRRRVSRKTILRQIARLGEDVSSTKTRARSRRKSSR
jgi:uncharacterized protein YcfJ